MTTEAQRPSMTTGYSPSMDRPMEERARDARDLAGEARDVVAERFGRPANGDTLEAVHRSFVGVGRRWEDLVHWRTLVGWGAFLGGIGVLLWGVGSISHQQMKVFRGVREQQARESAANLSLADRARALIGR